jgi:hypothetical protein
MAYDTTIERTTACPTAVVKVNTTWREVPTQWPPLLDEVWATSQYVEVAVEVGVQVTGPFEATGRVVPSTLPATEAATTHARTSAEIGAAHAAVRAWCAAQRRALTGVSWEIYGDPDPRTGDFDVAVYWEVAQPASGHRSR